MVRRLAARACLISLFVLLSCCFCGASVLSDGIDEHAKETTHDDASEVVKLDKQKADKDHRIDSFVNDDHEHRRSKTTDVNKYLKKDHATKAASQSDAFGGSKLKLDQAEDSQSDGYKRGHKKGHQKQGFQNSYHKDESSNKSTYFDDFNDEGDQAAYTSKRNKQDHRDGSNYRGSNRNAHEFAREQQRDGGHDRAADSGHSRKQLRDYGRDHYLRDLQDYNRYRNGRTSYERADARDRHEHRAPHAYHFPRRDPASDWPKWEGGRKWEQPAWETSSGWDRDANYDSRGPYDAYEYGPNSGHGYRYGESRPRPVAQVPSGGMPVPTNSPVVAHRKQTITIYEDPRYSGKDGVQTRREEGDYIQLDLKPSARRYAAYDTYYIQPR